jgi:bacterioferritin-associated ferredoxin
MWVCLCKGVTDRSIRAAVDAGARTTLDVALACRAGTGCGGCVPEVRRLICEQLGWPEALAAAAVSASA